MTMNSVSVSFSSFDIDSFAFSCFSLTLVKLLNSAPVDLFFFPLLTAPSSGSVGTVQLSEAEQTHLYICVFFFLFVF